MPAAADPRVIIRNCDSYDVERIRAKSFPSEERDGYVWVYMAQPGSRAAQAPAPELPLFSDSYKREQLFAHLPCGIDHGIIGGLIAQKWRLSPAFIQALGCHHQPDKSLPEHQQLVFIVALADIFSQLLDIGTCEATQPGTAFAGYLLERVGVDWPTLYDMRDTVIDEIDKAKIYLEISE